MWDEKKFFEDYVNESEKIKPDDQFVDQLKKMAVQEDAKKKSVPMIKYAALAASFLVCIGLGSFVWQAQDTKSDQDNTSFEAGLQAGNQVSDEGQVLEEQQTSEINESDGETSKGEETQDYMEEEDSEEALEEALNSLRRGDSVRDAAGNEVPQEEQEALLQLLKNARAAEEPEAAVETASYFLEGEKIIEIDIYEEGFLKVDGNWYH